MRYLPTSFQLIQILKLQDRRDLKQLCEVSKVLYSITIPELYATITIRAKNEIYLHDVSVKRFMAAGINLESHLQYVRNFRIRSSFHYNLEERCVHYMDAYNMQIDPEGARAGGFDELTTGIMSLLEQFEDQSLRYFRSSIPLLILFVCPANR